MWELENMPVQQALKSDLDKLRQVSVVCVIRMIEAGQCCVRDKDD